MTFDITPYRDLYPFQSRWLTVGGHRYHYVDEGRGDPIVLVHGNPTRSLVVRSLRNGGFSSADSASGSSESAAGSTA